MIKNGLVLVSILVFATMGTAAAAPVTFDTIGGVNGDPFSSLTENGVTVTSTLGSWQKGFYVGNPIPSIFTLTHTATVTVTTGALFTFLSFDLGTGGASVPSFAYHGFLNDVEILDGAGTPGGNVFVTIHSSNTSLLLDRLEITTTLTSSSANLDNITVGGVPEPAAVSLMALGLALILYARRRLSA